MLGQVCEDNAPGCGYHTSHIGWHGFSSQIKQCILGQTMLPNCTTTSMHANEASGIHASTIQITPGPGLTAKGRDIVPLKVVLVVAAVTVVVVAFGAG